MTDVEDLYPLTPMQAGLLFHSLAEPAPGLYVVQMCFELTGPLDGGALRAAWRAAVARHPALRTVLVWDGIAHPVQAVLRGVELPFVEHDLRDVPAGDHPGRVAELLRADRVQGFDLSAPPLTRVLLIRLAEDRRVMVGTHHHAIRGGWSTTLVPDEGRDRYGRIVAGGPGPRFPEVPPFREYVTWLARRAGDTGTTFWSGELAGYRRPVRMTLDRPDPAPAPAPGPPWYDRHVELTPDRVGAWRAAARRYQVSFPTLVQGSWAALLARHDPAAPDEVVYGVVTAVRDHDREGGDRVVGLCVNTVPMRVDTARERPVQPWLRGIQQTRARVAEHDAVDIGRFREWSQVPSDAALFRYLLAIEDYPQGTLASGSRVAGLRVRYLGVHEATNYPLTAGVPVGERPRLKLTADARSVRPGDVDGLLREWAGLLDRLASGDSGTVGGLVGAAASRRAATPAVDPLPAPATGTLMDRFAAQVARRPDAPAVTCGATTLTYAELAARARRLAGRLVALGAGPERRVGLVADRSLELVVGILGILWSGSAYVPLDPTYPAHRRQFVARDAGLTVVVTDRPRELRELAGMRVVAVEDGPAEAGTPPADPPPGTPGQLAYVIYTSGSTGQPKGVLVEHRNVLALLDATRRHGRFDERDVWTMCHAYAFDVSVFELWGALAHGGRLVVVPPDTVRAPDALHALVRAEQVTVFSQTPSAFGGFSAADARSATGIGDALRLVLFAGEDLGTVRLAPWLRRYGDRHPRLVNLYGITETTVHSTWEEVRCDALSGAGTTSRIGTGLPGWSVRLLDTRLRPVPDGEVGELYVGGAGLARGYAGRPGLSAGRFVPDPQSPGGRLYRSGDRARRLADGTLEYVGRADAQVKVRGVRIEPGEVESVLAGHPAVAQVMVTARRFGGDDVRLVAFVVPDGTAPAEEDLRRFAREWLPAALVPSRFVAVPALPATPSGKVDRAALERVEVPAGARPGGTPPRTPTERVVAAAWCAALATDRVGVDENFFDAGGHSLLMFGLLQRLRAAGWPELSMVELFANPTVATQARLLDRVRADPVAEPDGDDDRGRTRTAALRDLRARREARR